jgi:hypothetical protein
LDQDGVPLRGDVRSRAVRDRPNRVLDWPARIQPWLPELLASLAGTLARFDGTAGILRGQAPAPWNALTGIDAIIVSVHNRLT